MATHFAGIEFQHGVYKHPDTLGYHASHRGELAADALSRWGRGDHTDSPRPIPLELSHEEEDVPAAAQIASLQWLVDKAAEVAARLDRMVESAWRECYFGDHRPADEETDRSIQAISIPPPRDGAAYSKIVFTLDQEWEVEHGFYIILDPGNPDRDVWCWWDGLDENDVMAEHDDDDMDRFQQDIEQALAAGDVEAAVIIASDSDLSDEQRDELLVLAIAEFEDVDVMNMVMMTPVDPALKRDRRFSPVDGSCSPTDFAIRLRDQLQGRESGEGSAELNRFVEQKAAEAVHEFGQAGALERIERIIEELAGERADSEDAVPDIASIFGDGPLGELAAEFEQMLEQGNVDQLQEFAQGARGRIVEMQKHLRDQALGLMQQTLTPGQRSGSEPLPVDVEATMLQSIGNMRQHPVYLMVADVDPGDAEAAQSLVDRIGGTGGSPWFEVAEFAIDADLDDLFSKWVDAMPDVNERHNERTLLHLAVLKSRPSMASYLLARGADIGSRVTLGAYAAPGVTPAELARDMRRMAESMADSSGASRPQEPRGVYDALQLRMRVEPRGEVLERIAAVTEIL